MQSRLHGEVAVSNLSDHFAGLAVQGPESAELLGQFGELPTRNQIREFRIQGIPILLARTGYTGEDGFELFYPAAAAAVVWNHLLEVGAPLGVKPCGLGARDTLRMEVCYPLNGADLSPTRTPLEAGLGFFVDLEKPEFVGRNPLLAQKETGLRQRLVALKSDGKWTTMARQPIPWWWIPASEHPGHLATKRGWEVMSAVEQDAVKESLKNNGVFKIKDDKTGKELELEFVDTHQPVRQLDDNGHYFACTDFRVVGTKDQIYDIDFWVNDKDGAMTVEQRKVHKVPELKSGQWIQVPRYEWKDVGPSHVVP